MALTRDFRETVRARARREPAVRRALLREAAESMVAGDMDTWKLLLRNYINATSGFGKFGKAAQKSSKSLMRMLSRKGNPRAANAFRIFGLAQRREGVRFEIVAKRAGKRKRGRRP